MQRCHVVWTIWNRIRNEICNEHLYEKNVKNLIKPNNNFKNINTFKQHAAHEHFAGHCDVVRSGVRNSYVGKSLGTEVKAFRSSFHIGLILNWFCRMFYVHIFNYGAYNTKNASYIISKSMIIYSIKVIFCRYNNVQN